MHDFAHGVLPHKVIEVEESIVESFLGRIEDPELDSQSTLILLMIRLTGVSCTSNCLIIVLQKQNHHQYNLFSERIHQSILKTFKKYKGSIVQSDNYS